MKQQVKRRVVVTGIGPVCSVGIGKDIVWKNILKSKTGLCKNETRIDENDKEEFYLHRIKNFDISQSNINIELYEEIRSWKKGNLSEDIDYLIAAISLALSDSGLEKSEIGGLGMVIANESPGFGQFCSKVITGSYEILGRRLQGYSKSRYFREFYKLFSREAYDLQTFMTLYHIMKLFGVHGYSLFVNNACASGLYAIEAARQIIATEQCKAVIVGASDYPDVYKYLWFKENKMYARDGRIKPFAENSDGFVFGEGGTAIVLEEFEHALRRGAHIYAEYMGGGFVSEGFKVTLPYVGSGCYSDAMKDALDQSGVGGDEVDLICAHGVGTKITDQYEAQAINEVFKNRNCPPLVTAFKPYVGHNLGGCALLEVVIMFMSMEKDKIPPVMNNSKLNPKIDLNIVREWKERKIEVALKICCAFAGYDAAAIFRKLESK